MTLERTSFRRNGGVASQQQFAIRIMEHLVIPTFVIDANSKVLIWNKALERLTGVGAAGIVGTDRHWCGFYDAPRTCLADLVVKGRYSDIRSEYSSWDGFGLSDFGVSLTTLCTLPMTGRAAHLAIDCGPIYDDRGRLIAAVQSLRDVTAERVAQLELESLAARDGLTNLANRRSFDFNLQREIRRCQREQDHLALLMIDVDCFKAYNDYHGHPAGDECLRQVASAIRHVLRREDDFAARYGGEEFAIVLPGMDLRAAGVVAERVRRSVRAAGVAHEMSPVADVVTISVGVTAGRGDDLDAERLVSSADRALYQAKRDGRDQCALAELPSAVEIF